MKPSLLPSTLLLAALSSCGDSPGSKQAEGTPVKDGSPREEHALAATTVTSTVYSLSELTALGNVEGDIGPFLNAFTAWFPTASNEDLARLYNGIPVRNRYGMTNRMVALDALKTLEFAASRAIGDSSSTVGIQAFEAYLKGSPAAAFKRALELPPGKLRTLAIRAGFGSGKWGVHKDELIARFGELYEDEQIMLAGGLGRNASDAGMLATVLSTAPERARQAFIEGMAAGWVDGDRGTIEEFVGRLPEDLKAKAADDYFLALSSRRPQAALAMAEKLERSEVNMAAVHWAQEDPEAAVEYLAGRPKWEESLSFAFAHWLSHAPLEASSYATSRLTGRAAEVAAVEIVKECRRHGDEAGAQKWMETISDPVLRKRASTK